MAQEYIKIRKSPSDDWLVLPQPDSGALTFATVYTGSGAPDASLGADGDIYLDLG